MNYLVRICSVLLVLSLISSLIAGMYVVLRFVTNFFDGLDVYVASVIYAASIAALFSTVLVSWIWRWVQNRSSMEQMRMERTAVYQRLLAAWFSVLSPMDTASTQPAFHLTEDLQVAEQQLLLWGSRHVVKHYAVYQQHDTPHDPRNPAVQRLIEKVLQEMRQDLGQSNVGIPTGDLLNLFIDTSCRDDNRLNTAVEGSRTAHLLFNGVGYPGAE